MTDEAAPPPRPPRQNVFHEIPLFDSAQFEHMLRIANAMARSTLMPEHLRGEVTGKGATRKFEPYEFEVVAANALIIVNLAMKWRADPLAVAQAVSIVHGKVVFEGKLIAAIIENAIGMPLEYEWSGENMGRTIKVSGQRPTDKAPVSISGSAGDWQTKDSQGQVNKQWTGASQDKLLAYRGAREWCRLYMPGLILGLYGADEFDAESVIEHEAQPGIRTGFAKPAAAAAPALEHKPGVDVGAALAASAPKGEEVVVGVDLAAGADKHVEAAHPFSEEALTNLPATSYRAGPDGKVAGDDASEKGEKIDTPAPHWTEQKENEGLQNALHRAVVDLNGLQDEVEKATGTRPEFAIDGAESADAAQEQLGAINREVDRLRGVLRSIPREVPFEAIVSSLLDVLKPFKTWDAIRANLSTFMKQPEAKKLTDEQRNRVYRETWGVVSRLNAALLEAQEPMAVEPTTDMIAYRCALEACDDVEIVRHMWDTVTQSQLWFDQPAANSDKLRAATTARLEKLEAGNAERK